MSLRLTVVGCSGSFPGPTSPASCYLVEQEHAGRTWRLVLDLGNGALGALHRHADPLAIDAVALRLCASCTATAKLVAPTALPAATVAWYE